MSSALVVGPRSTGKTHLANVWRLRSKAADLSAGALGERDRCAADRRARWWSRTSTAASPASGCCSTCSIWRRAQAVGPADLGASRRASSSWALPDLRSRLRALPLVGNEMPDEALLGAVLVKLFADRQLTVEPQVVELIGLQWIVPCRPRTIVAESTAGAGDQRKVTRRWRRGMMALANGPEGRGPEAPDTACHELCHDA